MLKSGYIKRSIFHEGYQSCIYHFIRNDTKIGHFRIDYLDNCYEIWDFHIEFKYRGCGYGHKMLQECIRMFNNKPLECTFHRSCRQVLHIFHKFGFNIIKDDGICYTMRKEVK